MRIAANLSSDSGRGMAFDYYISVMTKNICPNAAPLQEHQDTFQTFSLPYSNFNQEHYSLKSDFS
jgi:hypothetical protein